MHWNAYHKTHSTVSNQMNVDNSRNIRENSNTYVVVCVCNSVWVSMFVSWQTHKQPRWKRNMNASAMRETSGKMSANVLSWVSVFIAFASLLLHPENKGKYSKKTFDMRTETIVLSLLSISTIVPHFSSTETWTNTKRSSWIHASHAMFYAWNSLGCGFLTFNRQRKPTTHWKKHQAKWKKKHQQQQLILNIPIAPSITVNSQRRSA